MAGIIETLAPDLRYVLQEEDVPVDTQRAIATQGYVSLKLFSLVGTTPAEIKEFCRNDLGIDPATGAPQRLQVAKIMSAWQTCCTRAKARMELDSQSASTNMPKVLPKGEHLALRTAFGLRFFPLEEKATPGVHLVELLEYMY